MNYSINFDSNKRPIGEGTITLNEYDGNFELTVGIHKDLVASQNNVMLSLYFELPNGSKAKVPYGVLFNPIEKLEGDFYKSTFTIPQEVTNCNGTIKATLEMKVIKNRVAIGQYDVETINFAMFNVVASASVGIDRVVIDEDTNEAMAVIGNAIDNITAYMNTVPTKDQAIVYTADATGGVWLDSVNREFKLGETEYTFESLKANELYTNQLGCGDYTFNLNDGNLYLIHSGKGNIAYFSNNSNKIVFSKDVSGGNISASNLHALNIEASGNGTLRIFSPTIDNAKFSGITNFDNNTVKKAVITDSQYSGSIVGGISSSSQTVTFQNYIANLGTISGGKYRAPSIKDAELENPIIKEESTSDNAVIKKVTAQNFVDGLQTKLTDGSVTVQKAVKDANGNDIPSTYQTKAEAESQHNDIMQMVQALPRNYSTSKNDLSGVLIDTYPNNVVGNDTIYILRNKTLLVGTDDGVEDDVTSINTNDLKIGDTLFLHETKVPDYWVSNMVGTSITLKRLETYDLTQFYTKAQADETFIKVSDRENLKELIDAVNGVLEKDYTYRIAISFDGTYYTYEDKLDGGLTDLIESWSKFVTTWSENESERENAFDDKIETVDAKLGTMQSKIDEVDSKIGSFSGATEMTLAEYEALETKEDKFYFVVED